METSSKADERPAGRAIPVGEPVMIVVERAADGTWVATPEYADDYTGERAPPCPVVGFPDYDCDDDDDDGDGNIDDDLLDSLRMMRVRTGSTSTADAIKMARQALACAVTNFKNDIRELVEDYLLNPTVEREVQVDTVDLDTLFKEEQTGDERACAMLYLLRHGLDLEKPPAAEDEAAAMVTGRDKAPAAEDEAATGATREKDDAGQGASEQVAPGDDDGGSGGGGDDDDSLFFKEKDVSAAGFVDRTYMRLSIKTFFDSEIDVHGESRDTFNDKHFWASFMSATGFVNRLWDVRHIVDVFVEPGLDEETRRATVLKMLGDVEQLLNDRASAVATGRFNLCE